MFHTEFLVEICQSSTNKLPTIVHDNCVGDSELTYDIFPYKVLSFFTEIVASGSTLIQFVK